MIAVDSNILIYSQNHRSEWHRQSRRIMEELAGSHSPWCIPWPCIHEFLAVVTNTKIFPAVEAMPSVLAQVRAWMESPSLRLIGEMENHWTELEGMITAGKLRGGAVHDARVAAICVEHGVTELWSADRDFSRIGRLRVRNPLV